MSSPLSRRSQSSLSSKEESNPPLSPTRILGGLRSADASLSSTSGGDSQQNASLRDASSVVSACATEAKADTPLRGTLGAEAIAHKTFVASLNKLVSICGTEPVHLLQQ